MGQSLPVRNFRMEVGKEKQATMNRGLRILTLALTLLVAAGCAAQAEKEDIVLARSDGYVFLVNGTSLSPRCNASVGGPVSHMAVKPDGDIICVGTTGWVYLLDRYDLSIKAYADWGGPLKHLAIQPNGNFAVANTVGTIYIGNGDTMLPTGVYAAYGGYQVDCLGVMASTGDVIVTLDSGHAIRLNGTTLAATHSVWWGSGSLSNLTVRADGQIAVTLPNDTCYIGAPDMNPVLGAWVNYARAIQSMTWRHDNDLLIVSEVGNLFWHNGSTMNPIKGEFYLGGPATHTVVRPDDSVVMVNSAGTVFIVDADMSYHAVWYPGYNTVTHMVAQNNGDVPMVTAEGDLWIARAADLAQFRHSTGYENMTHLALQQPLAPVTSIDAAKRVGDGAPVVITDAIVSAPLERYDETGNRVPFAFGIEEEDRSCGIMVLANTAVFAGDRVTVTGNTYTIDGQRVLRADVVDLTTSDPIYISPLGTSNRSTAGGAYGKQAAVYDDVTAPKLSTGRNNVGMLIKTWGKVTASYDVASAESYFYIDDGSGLKDGSTDPYTDEPNIGIRCSPIIDVFGLVVVPAVGTQAKVTGIMGVHQISGLNTRYILTTLWE